MNSLQTQHRSPQPAAPTVAAMLSSPNFSPDAAPPEAGILALGTKLLELARRQLRVGNL